MKLKWKKSVGCPGLWLAQASTGGCYQIWERFTAFGTAYNVAHETSADDDRRRVSEHFLWTFDEAKAIAQADHECL
jgi:hypothetical protein